jgi:hypothetical protein
MIGLPGYRRVEVLEEGLALCFNRAPRHLIGGVRRLGVVGFLGVEALFHLPLAARADRDTGGSIRIHLIRVRLMALPSTGIPHAAILGHWHQSSLLLPTAYLHLPGAGAQAPSVGLRAARGARGSRGFLVVTLLVVGAACAVKRRKSCSVMA